MTKTMSSILKCSVMLVGLVSQSLNAATLTIPSVYQVLKVNNQERTLSFFSSETTLQLEAQRHILVLQYQELFDDYQHDDHTKVNSEPFVVVFDMPNSDSVIVAPRLEDKQQALNYIKQPEITMVLASAVEDKIDNQVIFLEAFKHQRNQKLLAQAQRVTLKDNDESASTITESANMLTNVGETSETNKRVENPQALIMLNYWWQQASEQQQASFLKLIEKSTSKLTEQ